MAVLGLHCFQGFPLVVASQSYSLILVRGLLVAMASLIVHRGLWNTGSVVVECGLVALQHVGSSLTRDWTCVSCTGRWILDHWATREALVFLFTANMLYVPEKAMEPHSSTLAWKIPWTGEPGRLQSMGSLRVRHDWATSLPLFTFMHWVRKWQPTPVFWRIPGAGSLVGCRLWGTEMT